MLNLDWERIFLPSTPLLEIFIRGTITYLALFLLLRLVLKRQSGTVGITDLLVIVLIADAAQNAMAGEYTSITDGVLLVATIILWSYALDWLEYHVPTIHRLVHPPPLELVKDGRILYVNMRRELITKEDLMTQIREQGVDDLSQVKRAFMEGDGHISVVTADQANHAAPKRETI